MGHPAKQGGGLLAPPARLQTPDWRGFFPWMTGAMDELNRFRNAVLAVAAAAVAFWLINDWVLPLNLLNLFNLYSLWLLSLVEPRPW